MSFILDALKKSESDRQRQSRPDSAFTPSGPVDAPASRWLWVVGLLLVVNIAVLSYVLLRPDAPPAAPVPAPPSAAADSPSFKQIVNEVRASQPPQALREPGPGTQAPAAQTSIDETAIAAAPPGDNLPSTLSVAYKTFNEVRAEGSVQLPELHLDIHVYSETPADRFVFVNMSKYKESATLGEGPRVTEIVPEGVVLEHAGIQFLLPRE